MSRWIVATTLSVLCVVFSFVAGPGRALAQDGFAPAGQATPHGDVIPGRALRITISGELKFTVVSRNEKFFDAALGNATNGVAPLRSRIAAAQEPGTGSGGDVWFDPFVSINMDFQLAEEVHAFLQLETPFDVFEDAGGANTDAALGGGGSRRQLDVEQLYVDWAPTDELNLVFGVQDYKQDFTGRKNPVFIDIQHSESPFLNPTAAIDFGSPQSSSSGLVGTQEAAGALVRWQPRNSRTSVEAYYFTIHETFRENSDDVVWGAAVQQLFDADSFNGTFGASITVLQNDANSFLYTVGAGGSIGLPDTGLTLYGEAYGQWGKYISNAGGPVPGSARPPLLGRDIHQQEAFLIYGGGRLEFAMFGDPEVHRPYVDVSYWEVSGDSHGDDSKNTAFVSMENNNDTIVVEDGYYGLDIDSNYRAIKVKAGFNPGEKVSLEVLYAYFELQKNNGTGDGSLGARDRDKIGDEFDIILKYFATDYLTFRLGVGWLLNPAALGLGDDIFVSSLSAEVTF